MTRASAKAPADRRRSIIEATIPLVLEHGFGVTTKQIADAAGVAEGTIFRYFETKRSLLHDVLLEVTDPRGLFERFAQIDLARPLDERLALVVDILLDAGQRVQFTMAMLAAREARRPGFARTRFGPGDEGRGRSRFDPEAEGCPGQPGLDSGDQDHYDRSHLLPGADDRRGQARVAVEANAQALLEAIAEVLRPDLGPRAETAAVVARALVFAGLAPTTAHPLLRQPDQLVALIKGALGLDRPVAPV
ncbi:MAG: TetR/AcrR family transcriptional regulator [Propionibacteriaceae bacterium]|jgi:AcrR family transcriptional regulator|nr:TetR/AcrR family transcriptional regulator [Propionibacteriaceae bacterium]